MLPRLAVRVAALLAALCFASDPHRAQTTLDWSGGLLGGSVAYHLAGDPGELFGLKPSLSTGPTPLPGGTLDIGLDLIGLLQVGLLSPATGTATLVLPLPTDVAFAGVAIHAQFVTFPGAGVLVDDVSNRATFVASAGDSMHNTFGACHVARSGHTASLLPDGSVLVAGGDEPQGSMLVPLASLERYDPVRQEFALLATTLPAARSTHTATTLADGRILLAGGYDDSGVVVATADVFDPATGLVTPTGPMNQARTQHTATLLADGRVLVVGGSALFDLGQVLSSLAQAKKSTELYDPLSNTWTSGPTLPIGSNVGVIGQAASLLGNGQVLVTGGVLVASFLGIPIPSFSDDAWRYDPGTGAFVATAGMAEERAYHGSITLPDGTALVAGGADGDFTALSFFTRTGCERYDAATNSWTSAPALNHARAYPNLVDTGSAIVVVGGLANADVATGSGTPETITESIDHGLGGWSAGPATILPREVARAVAIDAGARVLFVGTGLDGQPTADRTAEQLVR
ncbi:MAG: kelch repeat-containing protein [Planctomycetota bacterium]